MNIIDKCTVGYWKQNKLKLCSVIFCMILSTALIMSLFITLNVFFHSQVASKKDIYGDYMLKISGVNTDAVEQITNNKDVENSFSSFPIGFSNYSGANPYKRYIFVMNADDGFLNRMPILLLSGHFPENENEIILPNHIGLNYKLDDMLELDLGTRTTENGAVPVYSQSQENEYLTDISKHSYKIVGFYDKAIFEDSLFPAFIAITSGSNDAANNGDIYLTLKSPYQVKSFQKSVQQYESKPNQELLSCYGINLSYAQLDIAQLFLVLICVLIILVIVLLFILNKNIVYISLGENRRKLYHRLHLLGALKKQFYTSAVKESAILTTVTIPFSMALGILGSSHILSLLSSFTTIRINKSGSHIAYLLLSILIIAFFILISLWLFIKSYAKINKKQRKIQQKYQSLSADSSIKDISRKYIKNNKKQTRSMITSIAICLFMFITFSCICSNMKEANKQLEGSIESEIRFDYYDMHMNNIEPIELYNKLKTFKGITGGNCAFRIEDGIAKVDGQAYRSQIYVFDDDYFNASFSGDKSIVFCNDDKLSNDYINGAFEFTRNVVVGNYDPFAENQKLQTEERNFSVDFSCKVKEYKKYLGAELDDYSLTLVYPYSTFDNFLTECNCKKVAKLYFNSDNADESYKEIFNYFNDNGYSSEYLRNNRAILQEEQNNYYLIRFFSTMFTVFIFVISVFNLLNITLNSIKNRISDYVVLYSLGTQKRDIQRMSVIENINYQIKGAALAFIPIVAASSLGYIFIKGGKDIAPYMPVKELLISLLVFMMIDIITVILSIHLLEKDKIVGYLKEKNL